MMNQTFTNGMDMSAITAQSDGNFAGRRKEGANRAMVAGKFQTNDGANSFQFLNRTGPIKIPHNKNKFMSGPGKFTTQSQQQSQQQVEDIFNVNDENFNSDTNKGFKGPATRQPGSRRELVDNHVVTGVVASQRPGTAPQTINGFLSQNQSQPLNKANRPMSPFTKVYQSNQLG